jgi:AcrR family transcriptional regulator
VSVNDLVAKVGGSKTNVYSYFGDKSGLFKAAMHALKQETLAPLQELDITDVALEVGLQRVARKLVETIRTKRHLGYQRLIFAEAARHPEIGRAWFRDGPVVVQSIIAQFLRRHQAEGRISLRVNVEGAAVMFHDMVAWDPLLRSMFVLTTKNDRTALSHADEAVSLFVAALTD